MSSTKAVQDVPVEALLVREQVRKAIDEESLADLAQSIREHGILQPLLAHREGSKLVLDDGHRRLAAAKRLGLATVPAIVDPRQLEAPEVIQRQLVCNCQRTDLLPIEKARAIDQLIRTTGWSAKDTAAKLGMTPPTVSRLLKLLELPAAVQEKVESGDLSVTAAYEIAQAEGAEAQEELAEQATAEKLSRDEVAAKRRSRESGFTEKPPSKSPGRIPLKLGAGRTLVASGPGLSSISDLVTWLEDLLTRAKRVRSRGVELATFARLLADEAKAEAGAQP